MKTLEQLMVEERVAAERVNSLKSQHQDLLRQLSLARTQGGFGHSASPAALYKKEQEVVKQLREAKLQLKLKSDEAFRARKPEEPKASVSSKQVEDLIAKVRNDDLRLSARVAAAESLVDLVFPRA